VVYPLPSVTMLLDLMQQRTHRRRTTAKPLNAAARISAMTEIHAVANSLPLVLHHLTDNPARTRLDAPALGNASVTPSATALAQGTAGAIAIMTSLPLALALNLRSTSAPPMTRTARTAGTARMARTTAAASQEETAETAMLTSADFGFSV
jgi:hypothetical protein